MFKATEILMIVLKTNWKMPFLGYFLDVVVVSQIGGIFVPRDWGHTLAGLYNLQINVDGLPKGSVHLYILESNIEWCSL